MAKNKYSPETKATALATLKANGGNVTYTATLLQIPRKTLEAWSKGDGMKVAPIPEGMVEAKAGELADKLDHIASLLANEMTNPEKIAKASLKDVSIAMGVTIDKRNLLRHQPTSITQRVNDDRQTYENVINMMIKEAQAGGVTIDRDEAIRLLEVRLPDVREILGVQ